MYIIDIHISAFQEISTKLRQHLQIRYKLKMATGPDSRFSTGNSLLEDGDGAKLSPVGINLVEIVSPSGMAGTGMVPSSPTPIPASPHRYAGVHANSGIYN